MVRRCNRAALLAPSVVPVWSLCGPCVVPVWCRVALVRSPLHPSETALTRASLLPVLLLLLLLLVLL